MRSCLKNTGPGDTQRVTMAIASVQIAKTGSAIAQQVRSMARFQKGRGYLEELMALKSMCFGNGGGYLLKRNYPSENDHHWEFFVRSIPPSDKRPPCGHRASRRVESSFPGQAVIEPLPQPALVLAVTCFPMGSNDVMKEGRTRGLFATSSCRPVCHES